MSDRHTAVVSEPPTLVTCMVYAPHCDVVCGFSRSSSTHAFQFSRSFFERGRDDGTPRFGRNESRKMGFDERAGVQDLI